MSFRYVSPSVLRAMHPTLAVQGSETSEAAARAMPDTERRRAQRQVLEAIAGSPDGLTDERITEITGLNPSTERPRRIELVKANLICDSGKTRPTRSGRRAIVWNVLL